jgi:hypothetical protein
VTAIVGLVAASGRVHLGGDSAGVSGLALRVRADAKVFRNGPFVFGFTTSFRMGQLLRHSLDPPRPPARRLSRFMATTFVDAIRECLKGGGWAAKNSDREEGGTFLVGVAGRLFEIADDYQVGEHVDGYAAVGCGADAAYGALYATADLGMKPRRRLTVALSAAERFSAGVRGPYCFVATRAPGH